jgi:hypothetical protein
MRQTENLAHEFDGLASAFDAGAAGGLGFASADCYQHIRGGQITVALEGAVAA